MSQTNRSPQPPPPERAFVGLDIYVEADASWFTGREDETAGIQTLVQDYPFILLTGYAGVGKTSLIRAALLPRQHAAGWQCVYLPLRNLVSPGSYGSGDIARGLRDLLTELVGEASPPGATLESALVRLTQRYVDTPVLMALDQFEWLVQNAPSIAEDLYQVLEQTKAGQWPNLRWLLAYRGDAEPDIGPPLQRIAGLVGGPPRYYVLPLSPEAATHILQTGLQASGVRLTGDNLLPIVLDELSSLSTPLSTSPTSSYTSPGVYPFQLQMVGQTLCQAAGDNDGVLTIDLYEGLGGVQGILNGYLTRQMERLGERRAEAEKILVALARLGRQSERQLQESTGLKAEMSEDDWAQLLADLSGTRLVRLGDDALGGSQIEIVHDLLAEMVERETAHQERELRRLRGTLALRAAALERGPAVMRSDVMGELYLWRKRITPSPTELRLLLHNGLMGQGPAWFWLRQIPIVGIHPFLLQAYESPLPALHRAGAMALAAAAVIRDAMRLKGMLEDADRAVQEMAARALLDLIPEMGWDEALVLRYLIETPHAVVRRAAARGLAQVLAQVGRDIIPALPKLLRDEDPEVRFIAGETLTQVAGWEDIPFLRQLLQDPDLDVLNTAWSVLTQVLTRASAHQLGELRAMLTDDDPYVQGAAREALTQIVSQMGVEDEPLLRELSQSDDPNVRREAALALVKILAEQGPQAIPDLRARLDDWDAEVRRVAGLALASALAHSGPESLPELRTMLENPDRPLRSAFAEVLTGLLAQQGRQAIPELRQLLEDTDPDVRRAARRGLEEVLAQVGRETIPELQAMLQDPNWDVWQAAGLALARVLSELGRPGLRELRMLLKEGEDPEVRRAGGQALAGVLRSLGRVSLPELQAMLKDEDGVVRQSAGRALAQVLAESGTRAIPELRQLLKNDDVEICQAARQALLNLVAEGDSEVLPLLRDLLIDEHPLVADAAREALTHVAAQLGRRAIPHLSEILQDRHPAARHAAAGAIAALNPERGLQAWAELVVAYPLDNEPATQALVALDRRLYCPFAKAWEARFAGESSEATALRG